MNRFACHVALATVLLGSTAAFAAPSGPLVAKDFIYRKNLPRAIPDPIVSTGGSFSPASNAPGFGTFSAPTISIGRSFEGTSDYDSRALGRALIPPDTMGAVGTTQYVQLINGSFSVYDKATGALAGPRITDTGFWTNFGGGATAGDPRILFDKRSSRWLAIGFDASGAGIRVGVSETANALGNWKTSVFTGFAPGIADYPTLSISGNSVLIGTNNFASVTGGFAFSGTTVNVLNYKDVFKAAGPDLSGLKQLQTPYFTPATLDMDRGFSIQGVNRSGGGGPATVVSASLFFNDTLTYQINDAGGANPTVTPVRYLSESGGGEYLGPAPARQPTLGGSARVIDALDDRISANAWEVKGKIYFVHTVRAVGTDHDVVRIVVLDKATGNVLSETDITDPSGNFDFYQGSLAVNSSGQLVVGFNRSGSFVTGPDGKISVFARAYNTNADGTLVQTADDVLLKQSLVSDYHNGSAEGFDPVGRQRWGDYSSVTLDPTDRQSFWVTGQFAREFNNAAGGHPGGTGFARWGTWISEVIIAGVPEPGSWALMIVGFGMVGGTMRRQRQQAAIASA